MPDLGFGLAAFGSSSFGYGESAVVNSTSAKLYLDTKGAQHNAAEINTVTGDLVRDPETGLHRGMDSVGQMVYLALRTLKGSSIVRELGINMRVKLLSETTTQKVRDAVNEALSNLVSRQLVEVTQINAERFGMTGLRVSVIWKNLTNGETETSRWSNG